jgi:hypothetical protein
MRSEDSRPFIVRRCCTCFGAVALLFTGCVDPPATVMGRVTIDGAPLVIGEGQRGTVVFQPVSGNGSSLSGIINREGRFELAAGSSVIVEPGDYNIAVSAVQIVPPTDDNPEPSGKRMTPAKYASTSSSGLQSTINPGMNDINVAIESEDVEQKPAKE